MRAAASRSLRVLARRSGGSAWTRSVPQSTRSAGLATTSKRQADNEAMDALDAQDEDVDQLAGKASGAHLRAAFAARAAAALRYDYFAQRAELEAELEAASSFRGMKSVAEQQALGFLELLEEYGSGTGGVADGEGMVIGTTLDNVAGAALAEKADAEVYRNYAESAEGEGFEQLSEWMGDMADASDRVADRLEVVSTLMDDDFEGMGEVTEEIEEMEATGGKK